ncbi:hypothetical protein WJ977_25395 [Achromobacter xylosoxidans]
MVFLVKASRRASPPISRASRARSAPASRSHCGLSLRAWVMPSKKAATPSATLGASGLV